jgi:ubiquinone/menaquinone biosynthesis C-methylase UbiE
MNSKNISRGGDRLKRRINTSQRYFNPVLLSLYDIVVYRFVSRFIWGCSTELLIQRYDNNVSQNHLEVGVGTGYLMDNCNPKNISLDLMDLSSSCLRKSSKRLRRYSPAIIRHNILETPIEEDKRYDSIGINYVMHCVAGDYTAKGVAFGNLKKLLKYNGVIFGAAVLHTDQSSGVARTFMNLLNRIGVFNNANDRLEDLEQALKIHFKHVIIDIRSSVALFVVSDEPKRL